MIFFPANRSTQKSDNEVGGGSDSRKRHGTDSDNEAEQGAKTNKK